MVVFLEKLISHVPHKHLTVSHPPTQHPQQPNFIEERKIRGAGVSSHSINTVPVCVYVCVCLAGW